MSSTNFTKIKQVYFAENSDLDLASLLCNNGFSGLSICSKIPCGSSTVYEKSQRVIYGIVNELENELLKCEMIFGSSTG